MTAKEYKACNQCILDISDPDILFNHQGVCYFCEKLLPRYEMMREKKEIDIEESLQKMALRIRRCRKNSKYDCILGLSGGVDSSYTAYLIVEKMKLNPLIVHVDNGWNSKIAVENINNIVNKLNLDMVTYLIHWEEFKDLQRSFLYASVIDIEMLTDNAIYGAVVKIAKKNKIRSIISGSNFATESGLPLAWRWEKIDAKNIRSIHSRFGKIKLKTYPLYSLSKLIFDRGFYGMRQFYPLDIIKYSRTSAIQLLETKFNWQNYGDKHGESHFTKFYQNYILPKKFGIDKRRAHLSSLIRNQEIARNKALQEMTSIDTTAQSSLDVEYVRKKLGFNQDEFDKIICATPISHLHYVSSLPYLQAVKKLKLFFKPES